MAGSYGFPSRPKFLKPCGLAEDSREPVTSSRNAFPYQFWVIRHLKQKPPPPRSGRNTATAPPTDVIGERQAEDFSIDIKRGGEDNVSMFMGNPSLCYSISSINYTLISYIANSPGQRIVVSFLFNLYKVHRLISFTNPPSNKSALRRALRSLWQPIINPE